MNSQSNPVLLSNWWVWGTGIAGAVSNHPRQEEFEKPQQISYPRPMYDDREWVEGDMYQTDNGTWFVLGAKSCLMN